MRIFSNKDKIGNITSLLVIILPLLFLLNFVVIMDLGRPTGFVNTLENYNVLFTTRLVVQIIIFLLSLLSLYIGYFQNVDLVKKLVVTLFIILFNLPLANSLFQIPGHSKGVNVKIYDNFEIISERNQGTNRKIFGSSSRYSRSVILDTRKFELSNDFLDQLDCPKGDLDSEWKYSCTQKYKFYYLDFKEGLIKIEKQNR